MSDELPARRIQAVKLLIEFDTMCHNGHGPEVLERLEALDHETLADVAICALGAIEGCRANIVDLTGVSANDLLAAAALRFAQFEVAIESDEGEQ